MTSFTDNFDWNYLLETMMGPNAMRVTEELASFLPLRTGMRVLDLGCGMGLSSVLLAKQYNVTVYAADLWISPTDNYERFKSLGLEDRVIPLSVDATKQMPFAEGYFDMLVSVDSYHYFGNHTGMLPLLMKFVKKGGQIAIAVPGLKKEFPGGVFPEELQPFWQPDMNFYTTAWWRALWEQAEGFRIDTCREMDCAAQAWADWLQSPNPYAQGDIPMMEAEGGKYYNLVQITGTVL